MKPIEKISYNLFQNLRSRFSPLNMGDENAEITTDPTQARFFSFNYKENNDDLGPVSISIINNTSLKIFYTNDMIESMRDEGRWFDFLKELRFWAKKNLLTFDARDIQKDQLDARDFKFLKQNDGPYKEHEVELSESAMFGSKKRSYQTFENARLIVNHYSTVDENIRGSRSRRIESIFIERNDGERYRFPINYLNGARSMAVHISEGGTPYDAVGEHITNTVKEMLDLSRFGRLTRRVAMENADAADIRTRVVERYTKMRKDLSKLQNRKYYKEFAENYQPNEVNSQDGNLDLLREKFTRKIWNEQMEELLPTVNRALGESLNEASPSVENTIRNPKFVLVLKKDSAADDMLRSTKFGTGGALLAFILSDIAGRALGDEMDAVANFAADMAEKVNNDQLQKDNEFLNDKKLALMLAQKYMDDAKKLDDPEYAAQVRKDPNQVYGKKKTRSGGVHENDVFENWAKDTVGIFESDFDEEEQLDELAPLVAPIAGAAARGLAGAAARGLAGAAARGLAGTAAKGLAGAALGSLSSDDDDEEEFDIAKAGKSLAKEATTQGTVGTQGTNAPADPKEKIAQQQAAKNVSRVAQAAGIKTNPAQIAQGMAASAQGKPMSRPTAQTITSLGSILAQKAAEDPKKAAAITAMMKRFSETKDIDQLYHSLQETIEESDSIWGSIKNAFSGLFGKKQPNAQTVNTLGKSDSMNPIAKTNTVSPPPMKKPDATSALKGMAQMANDPVAKVAKDLTIGQRSNTGAKANLEPKSATFVSDYGKQSKSLQDLVNKALASKGKPAMQFNNEELDDEFPVMEKQLTVKDPNDQDGDGDSDFADVQISRMTASGMDKQKAIAKTKNKTYNEDELEEEIVEQEEQLFSESLQLLKKYAGL